MRLSRQICLALAAATVVYACAYPEFQFEEEDDDGGGGMPTSTTSSVGGGGGAGATSVGGSGPVCNLLDAADPACETGTKCGVVDPDSGAVGCVEAGTRPVWSRCDADAECAAGLFCDTETHICRPYCQSANNCPASAAKCIDAPKPSGGGTIPNVKVCTAHCHPVSAAPCDNGSGPTTCFFDTQLVETDCGATANANLGAACSSVLQCRRGALCVGSAGNTFCREVCTDIDSICDFDGTNTYVCVDTNPQLQYESTVFGVCVPL